MAALFNLCIDQGNKGIEMIAGIVATLVEMLSFEVTWLWFPLLAQCQED